MKEKNVKSRWLNKLLLIPVVLVALFLANCQDDETKVVFDPSLPVKIESFSPDTGGVGTQLVIKGENFGSDREQVKVLVGRNKYEAAIVGVDGKHIYAVVAARSDTGKVIVQVGNGENMRSDTSKTNFDYIIRANVSTLAGTGEDKTLDGPRDPSQEDAAAFHHPRWLVVDNDDIVYVLAGNDDGGDKDQRLRIIKGDEVTTGFSKKENGRQGRLRNITMTVSQDSILVAHDDGDANKAAFFVSTRANGFMDLNEVVTHTNQCNTAAANPVNGLVFINSFGSGRIFYYDPKNGETTDTGVQLGENKVMHYCWSLDGTKLFIVVAERCFIACCDYNLETGKLSNAVPVAGLMNVDNLSAQAGFADGPGPSAQFDFPCSMIAGPDGDYFIADCNNHCIRRMTADYVVSTYAGTPRTEGFQDGLPSKSLFRKPEGLAIDKNGVIYVADRDNCRIRKIVIE